MSEISIKSSNLTKEEQVEREKVIKLLLIRVGIKCDFVGYTYLSHSIQLVLDNPKLLYDLRALSTIVAKDCGEPNPFRVEANIQNAIKYTYSKKGFEAINELYGMQVLRSDHKPTTAELINLCAEYYRLGLYKNPIAFTNNHIVTTRNDLPQSQQKPQE